MNLSVRLNNHYCGKGSNIMLQQAFKKYGLANFSIQIWEYCDKSLLIKREQYYIDLFKPKYNLSPTAGSSFGVKHTKEARKNMS